MGEAPYHLDLDGGSLVVRGGGLESRARFWLPPLYHGTFNAEGEAYNSYAFTHADRVRISPVEGCAMTCKFCDLPCEFRYPTGRVEGLLDAVRPAATDEVQPASHVLISGGTPRYADIGYVRDVYSSTRVEAIAQCGAVPVLSPFRPDPSTPMRDHRHPPMRRC